MDYRYKQNKKGFTLLFAILVSTLVLAVGASIINLALKQSILSSIGRESQYAFYAATTGLECAVYWDYNSPTASSTMKIFPLYSQGQSLDPLVSSTECGATDIYTGTENIGGNIERTTGFATSTDGNADITEFTVAIRNDIDESLDDVEFCADVEVRKEFTGGKITTTITSRGINTCQTDDELLNNRRATERGLLMYYEQ